MALGRGMFRGRVRARGLLLTRSGPDRALALWAPGVTVRQTELGLVVLFAENTWLDTRLAPGLPLVSSDGRLCTAPLPEPALPGGPLVAVHGGAVVDLGSGEPVDPSAWLDTQGWCVEAAHSLGRRPAAAQAVAPSIQGRVAAWPGVAAPPSPEAAEILSVLQPPAPTKVSAWARGLAWLYTRLRGGSRGPRAPGVAPSLPAPQPPGIHGVRRSWLNRLDSWVAGKLVDMGLGLLAGTQHRRYLRELLDHFEAGRLDDALKRAIPLGGEAGLDAALAGLRAPSPRDALEVQPRRGGGQALLLGDQLRGHLEALYRQAAARLEREGRWAEAAFVRAELLNEPEEAVAMLEGVQAFAQAARVAEVRELAPGLVVRLWFLAGEVERAMAVARRTGAFADALERLTVRDHAATRMFRLAWAATLVSAGSYGSAARLLGDAEPDHPLVVKWFRKAVELGDLAQLPRLVAVDPAAWEDMGEVVRDVVDKGTDRECNVLAIATHSAPKHPALRPLERLLIRGLIRRVGLGGATRSQELLIRQLVRRSGGALYADVAPLALGHRPEPKAAPPVVIAEVDVGTRPVHAAVPLPRGRLLVALGEAGLVSLRRDGRVLTRWERPAHDLVLSWNGARAIGVARRGGALSLSRIDLGSGRAEAWTVAPDGPYARHVVDGTWFVADGARLQAVDTLTGGWRSIWSVDLEEKVIDIVLDAHAVVALTLRIDAPEGPRITRWRYTLPDLRLRSREAIDVSGKIGLQPGVETDLERGRRVRFAAHPAGEVVAWLADGDAVSLTEDPVAVKVLDGVPDGVWLRSNRALLAAAPVARLVSYPDYLDGDLAHLTLEGSGRIGGRLDGGRATIWDDRGRIFVLHATTGVVESEYRV